MADHGVNKKPRSHSSQDLDEYAKRFSQVESDILEYMLAGAVEVAIGNKLIWPDGAPITRSEVYRAHGFETEAAERILASKRPINKATYGKFESVLDYINDLDTQTSLKRGLEHLENPALEHLVVAPLLRTRQP